MSDNGNDRESNWWGKPKSKFKSVDIDTSLDVQIMEVEIEMHPDDFAKLMKYAKKIFPIVFPERLLSMFLEGLMLQAFSSLHPLLPNREVVNFSEGELRSFRKTERHILDLGLLLRKKLWELRNGINTEEA